MDMLEIAVLAIAFGFGLSCASPSDDRTAVLPDGIVENRSEASNQVDQYGPIVAMYGRPERDDSTENDVPQPTIVTRFIEYRPENVKIVFVPIAKFGEPPPYLKWNVIGYIDMDTNTKMSKYQVAERLQSRRRSQP
jgi:hypothetical protein